MLGSLAAVALALAPLQLSAGVVDPGDFGSQSGEWMLHLEPSTRAGRGSARYAMQHRNEAVWEKELSFTFSELHVTDAGAVVGHGLTTTGELFVAAISPEGAVLLEERTPRVLSRIPHAPSDPHVREFFVYETSDLFAVRVGHSERRRVEHWWRFSISTGERLETWIPSEQLEWDPSCSPRLAEVRALSEGLLLMHWATRDAPINGATYALVNAGGCIVWRLDLPRDFTIDGDRPGSLALLMQVREEGTILAAEPRSFELLHARDNERVEYDVILDDASTDTWEVREVSRAPYEATAREPGTSEPFVSQPTIGLEELAPLTLERPARTFRGGEPGVVAAGKIGVRDEDTEALHVWTESGEYEGVLETDCFTRPYAAPIVADSSAVWLPCWNRGTRPVYFGRSWTGEALGELDLRGRAAPRDDGRFWTWHLSDPLRLRTREGEVLHSVHRRPDGRWIRQIEAAALDIDGTLLALERDWEAGESRLLGAIDETSDAARWALEVQRSSSASIHPGPHWTLIAGESPQLVRRSVLQVLALDEPALASSPCVGLSADGNSILAVGTETLVVRRFALPED